MSAAGVTRVGLVSDSHDAVCEDWPAVVAEIAVAFTDPPVDVVLHCGDIATHAALDDLERATGAPVHATRSLGDEPEQPPRLLDGPRVIELPNGHRVLLAFARPEAPDPSSTGAVAAVVFGGTHEPSIEQVGGLLWVNPGSPSLAERRSVAVLTLGDGTARAEIVPLG